MEKSPKGSDSAPAPHEPPRARVVNWLRRALESGEVARGSELPSARAIARMFGIAPNTAVTALEEAERLGLVVCREGAHRRYAGTVGADTFASSSVFVLASMDFYRDIATAPGWSDEFLALDVVRRLSLMGRPVSLINSLAMPEGGLDAVFKARPKAMVVTNSVRCDPLAMEALQRCREADIPAVAYGNAPELRGYDRAYSDHRAGSRDLTRWLIKRGCRRIVPLFPAAPALFWQRERIEGYNEAMREAGLEPHPVAVFGSSLFGHDWSGEKFRLNASLALSAILALKRESGAFPDALLCCSDGWAQSALAAIRDLELVPNRDILVAGYDNNMRTIPPCADALLRPAVTVDKHNECTAKDIAELILARMDGTLPPEPQARIHEHELVVLEGKT